MALKNRLLLIYIIFITTEGMLCLDIAYLEEHSDGRLPCKHEIPDDELRRVKWFKSTRRDIFEDGDPVLVSWDGASKPHTTNNYGIDIDFSLVIYNSSINNQGIYRCYVTRNKYANLFPYDIKLISYGKVKSAHPSAVQYATSVRLPCHHNIIAVKSVFWYKRNINDSFKNDDQPIASWADNESHFGGNYTLTDDFSLEIQNVSFENEAVYRCIVVSTEETKPSASDTIVTVYVLPKEFPVMQHLIQTNASFINCSVDHVYPLLYPEFKFINKHQRYDIQNGDGTYNTSIKGKVPDLIHNTTVECSFPHFNYTGKSSYYIPVKISVENAAPYPKDCSVPTCPNQAESNIWIVFLLLIPCLIVAVIAVFIWKRHKKQQRQKDVKKITRR